jgi:phosphate transport system permease protein
LSQTSLFLAILGLGFIAWITARAKASQFAGPGKAKPDSLPNQHGWHMALWAVLPALLFVTIWSFVAPGLVRSTVMATPAAKMLPASEMDRNSILEEARGLADGSVDGAFHPESAALAAPFKAAARTYGLMGSGITLLLALAGAVYGYSRVRPQFRARNKVERAVMVTLILSSLVAILTTFGIVGSLLFESSRFFSMVSPVAFLTGLQWSPQAMISSDAKDAFGAVPLFWGTAFIGAIIAMIVAIPFGLMSAIYLTQYARPAVRKWMKPLLEMLAGVPTVVYGYFAALTVAPALHDFAANVLGMADSSSESALAAGGVMGVMIIPFVSSMADDSLAAVPQSMRDGSLALGATTSETIRKVLVPAALPGIVGGVLLAVSRAIGETMIVVMAAGLAANLTANPFASVTTVTTQIVQLLTGDQEFDSPKTLSAFALGLVLFLVTLLLNVAALRFVKKYREAYD